MILPIILYVISLILYYLLSRIFIAKDIDNITDLLIVIVVMFVPLVNIIFVISIAINNGYDNNDIKKLTSKIFLLKDGTRDDNFKGKKYR